MWIHLLFILFTFSFNAIAPFLFGAFVFGRVVVDLFSFCSIASGFFFHFSVAFILLSFTFDWCTDERWTQCVREWDEVTKWKCIHIRQSETSTTTTTTTQKRRGRISGYEKFQSNSESDCVCSPADESGGDADRAAYISWQSAHATLAYTRSHCLYAFNCNKNW